MVTLPALSNEHNEAIYLPVKRPGGIIGYVHRDYLRSVIGLRVVFDKDEQGIWRVCGFYSGA